MKCEVCHSADAQTVIKRNGENGRSVELFVCKSCAEKEKEKENAANPDIPAEGLVPFLEDVDMVLVMSVFAGFGGQKFIPEALDKVRFLRQEIDRRGLKTLIEVDGGVNADNAKLLREAGADVLVAGSSVFKAPSMEDAIMVLKNA